MPDATPTLDQLLAIGGLGTGPYGGGDVVRWSPDGTQLLAYAGLGGEGALWLIPRAGGFPRRVTVAPISLPFLASPQQSWSPNGSHIAYLSEQQGATELWLWDAATGQQRPLTRLGNSIASYAWEPHGQSLLLATNQQGAYDIYRVNLASGVATRLTSDSRYEVSPAPTPDGRHILYVRLDERWAGHEVVRMDGDGGNPTVIARDEDFFDYHYGRTFGPPIIAPNSSQLLFRSHRSGWINYWSVTLAGGDPQPLAPQDADQSGATWSPDGRHVAFVANHNGTLALSVCDVASGAIRVLVQPDMGVCTAPAWSPDGKTLAFFMTGPAETHDLWLVEVASGACQRLTDSMPAGGLREQLARPEKIVYRSFDGLPISAYVYWPQPQAAGQRCPAVLLIHGGPTMQFLDSYDSLAQFLCSRGYVVLLPNIRGSSGYGKAFEDLNNGDWGHGDLRDAIAGADWLRAQATVDGAHIGITGTSYGGCLSMAAVCNAPGQFQAAAPHAGYADWLHVMDEQERRHLQLMRYEFGEFPEQAATYRRCSPIFNARQASTPTLVLHGTGQLPQSDASRRFVEALRREYKTVDYKVYPNECYYVRSKANLKQMYLDIAEFFDRYLK